MPSMVASSESSQLLPSPIWRQDAAYRELSPSKSRPASVKLPQSSSRNDASLDLGAESREGTADFDREMLNREYTDQTDASLRTEATEVVEMVEIRMIEPVRRARRIQTEFTIASVILGRSSQIEAQLFRMAVKDPLTSRVVWTLWWIGCLCGLLSLAHIVPEIFIWSSILMIPVPVFFIPVLSVDILSELSKEFECYLVTLLQSVVIAAAMILLRDVRCVFWACFALTMMVSILVDAYPQKFRSFFSKLFFIGMMTVLIVWDILLAMDWCAPVHVSKWNIGHIAGALSSLTFTTSITLLLFCYRHLKTAVYSPENFVVIKSPVKTFREKVEMEIVRSDNGEERQTGHYRRNLRSTQPRLSIRVGDETRKRAKLIRKTTTNSLLLRSISENSIKEGEAFQQQSGDQDERDDETDDEDEQSTREELRLFMEGNDDLLRMAL